MIPSSFGAVSRSLIAPVSSDIAIREFAIISEQIMAVLLQQWTANGGVDNPCSVCTVCISTSLEK